MEHPQAQIRNNRKILDGLIEDASIAIEQSHFRSAATTLQTAARFAWYNHPGIFRSLELEDLAVKIGDRISSRATVSNGVKVRTRDHVLHVLSQAYSTGGHSRLVWRWIENDSERVHSVVLTGQKSVPIPRELRLAVSRSGGEMIRLGKMSSSILTRALELRRIVSKIGAGVVVLHIHPYDVVPLIALAHFPVKVIFVNHADHVFWIGGAVANVLADIRPSGKSLSLMKRDFAGERSVILPIPLKGRRAGDRTRARALLGLEPDSILVISIASSYKFAASRGDHFVDVHRDYVIKNPKVVMMVVGPSLKGRWQEVSDETGGRFRSVGFTEKLGDYYDAADIYVDSLPFASLTSLIDAVVWGLPVIGLSESVPHSVLASDDISLPSGFVQYSDRRGYLDELQELTSHPEHRRQVAAILNTAVVEDHLSPGWNQHLESLYRILNSSSAAQGPAMPKSAPLEALTSDPLEIALVEFQFAAGLSEKLWDCQMRDAPLRSLRERVHILRAAPRGHRTKTLQYLLPDVIRSTIGIAWRVLSRR